APRFRSSSSIPCSTAEGSVTSKLTVGAGPVCLPACLTAEHALVIACWSRPCTTTVAPCSASPWASARPSPREDPVTRASIPVRLNMLRWCLITGAGVGAAGCTAPTPDRKIISFFVRPGPSMGVAASGGDGTALGGAMAAPVLHSDILDTLGAEIADGALARGDVLTLAGLERRFGVSRTVVREAMRILESLGMVHAKRRVGLTVQPSSSWSLLDPQVIAWRLAGSDRAQQLRSLTQLRVALEPVAARLAAAGDSDAGARLVPLARRLRELGEAGQGASAEYLEADIEFHSLLLSCGGNELFASLAGTVAEVLSGR